MRVYKLGRRMIVFRDSLSLCVEAGDLIVLRALYPWIPLDSWLTSILGLIFHKNCHFWTFCKWNFLTLVLGSFVCFLSQHPPGIALASFSHLCCSSSRCCLMAYLTTLAKSLEYLGPRRGEEIWEGPIISFLHPKGL